MHIPDSASRDGMTGFFAHPCHLSVVAASSHLPVHRFRSLPADRPRPGHRPVRRVRQRPAGRQRFHRRHPRRRRYRHPMVTVASAPWPCAWAPWPPGSMSCAAARPMPPARTLVSDPHLRQAMLAWRLEQSCLFRNGSRSHVISSAAFHVTVRAPGTRQLLSPPGLMHAIAFDDGRRNKRRDSRPYSPVTAG
jgi:hypothetical protein